VTDQGDLRDGILVPEHFVPMPSTISPQAQAMLRMEIPNSDLGLPKSLDDSAAWKTHRENADAGIVMMSRHLADLYPCDVATHDLSESKIYEITPKGLPEERGRYAIYFVHGGGFMVGGGEAAIYFAMQLAGLARCKVYASDYRMVPEVSFPIPVEDTLEGYRFVLDRHPPERVAVYGPSAGANLAPAAILMARDRGIPMPAACVIHSCPSDMTTWGDSAFVNDTVDIMLRHYQPEINAYYMGNHPDLKDPYASPVYADYSKGFPPTILLSGTRDILLSGTVRLHRAMVRAGVKADLHVFEAMPHVPFFGAPEEEEFNSLQIDFMLVHIGAG
jgi:acetyl esterase/lipase